MATLSPESAMTPHSAVAAQNQSDGIHTAQLQELLGLECLYQPRRTKLTPAYYLARRRYHTQFVFRLIADNCCLQSYPLRLRVQALPTAKSRRKGRSATGKCRPSTYCCDKSSSRGNTDRRRPSSTPTISQSYFRSLHRVLINEMIF